MIEDKFDLTFYCGEDLYSDGDVENELLEAVQKKENIEKCLIEGNSWPHLYHLSNIRENILEWYDFNPKGSLLEIGAGCGAVTGLFCSKVERVVAIDLSKRRSMVNATRNEEYNNLTIMLGNFEDIKIEEKFDYVTLVGVFEYSIYYISSDDPFGDMLKKAKSFLKPGGKLIIAIENKYGMKYFAGATEDHSGRMFDGIENYAEVDRVRTFSRRTLEKMLTKAGFEKNDFYYPMPDYKLPSEIYSDKHMPSFGSIRNACVSYDRDRYELIDERLFADAACEDDMFADLANSFLIISHNPGTEETKAVDAALEDTEYAKYNRLRAPEYQISTRIYTDASGKRVAEKKALRKEAVAHIEQLSENRKKLLAAGDTRVIEILSNENGKAIFPYIKGRSLEDKVNAALNKKDKLLAAMHEAMASIYTYDESQICPFEITEAYKKVFGESGSFFAGHDALKVANVDSTFANFVEAEDGGLVCLDYEWVFDFPVPLEYLKYRTLYYYFSMNRAYIIRHVNEQEFLQEFGLSAELVAACMEMDDAFQQFVHGENRKYIYTRNYEKKVYNLGKNMQHGESWFMSIVEGVHKLNQELGPHRRDLVECEVSMHRKNETIDRMKRVVKNPALIVRKVKSKLGKEEA